MRSVLVHRKGLHDYSRPHVAQMTLQKLNKLGYETLPHTPDLSPTEYHFFKHLYHFMKENKQSAVEKAFRGFIDSRTLEFQVNGIYELISRWQKCINCNDSYFD
ncbi:Histone-lysine N-methyltransferase SETMAR [Araneus ventricosus]|uniref:Histone-lysine N-methyltransferase SETMAR n=1 Tax=Araneus ventricosus TaxID=182803 RepID=A0A4Y2APD2_ARAVE|nr:Histone-lysine N-methyltransferase SETMAR [Araneus ventricosus]